MYATTLYETLRNTPRESWSSAIHQFLLELVRRGEMKLIPKILSYCELLEERREGRVHVTVRSAHPIDRSLIESSITRLLPAIKPVIEEVHDPSMIGGVSLETRDRRFDMTLKRGLANLRQTMIHS